MANEYTINCSVSASKGGASINTVGSSGAASKNHDMSGADMTSQTQQVGTSYEAIDIPADLTPVGVFFVHNLDTTNFCVISLDGGTTDHIKIRPGHRALFQPMTSMQIKFDTLAGQVFFGAGEE